MHEAKKKAQETYNAAADFFDDPALAFWERFGRGTVERLNLPEGGVVLDVCAGSGASAIPAAERVGPTGTVIAVDLAQNLLALAREKARRLGLSNLETRVGDAESLTFADESFDAVVIVFGVFFLPNMTTALADMWRMVKPGGQLAVTTWGPRLWEPASSLFWNAVNEVRPDLNRAYNPWDSLTDSPAVRSLLLGAGIGASHVDAVPGAHTLEQSDDFWKVALGSGLRATIDAMNVEDQRTVRTSLTRAIADQRITAVETNVIYASATKTEA